MDAGGLVELRYYTSNIRIICAMLKYNKVNWSTKTFDFCVSCVRLTKLFIVGKGTKNYTRETKKIDLKSKT